MAARRTKTTPKPRGAPRARAPRQAKPVLGNDPFERGAAPRPAASPVEVPATMAPVVSEPEIMPASEPEIMPASEPEAGNARETASVPSHEGGIEPALPAIRAQLSAIESRVESAAASAASRLGELARQEAAGHHARDLLRVASRLLPALRHRLAPIVSLGSLVVGTREIDAYGFDREFADRAGPILELLYRTWWRVEARQIEMVPAEGPVVIAANVGGVLPWEALVLRVAIMRDHRAHRADLRPLLDEHALAMPVVGALLARLGAVAAKPENALRLLEEGGVIATFPEGSNAATRPWPDRYRIQRFGRGGFVKLAVRAGAPIVPCAIVGSEETSIPISRAGWLSGVLGMPFLKSPPALPFAALGLFPLPARWSLRFGPPIETSQFGPEGAQEPARVLEITERVRSTLQQMLDEDVAARGSVYL